MTASQMSAFLSYISVFFAPILVPFLVWLLGDRSAKAHATKALLSHLLPALIVMAVAVAAFLSGDTLLTSWFFWVIFSLTLFLEIIVMVLNVIWAIRVVKEPHLSNNSF